MKTTNENFLFDIKKELIKNIGQKDLPNNSELALELKEKFNFRNITILEDFISPCFLGEINITKIDDQENNLGQETLKSWISDDKKFEILEYFGQQKSKKGYFTGFVNIYVYVNED